MGLAISVALMVPLAGLYVANRYVPGLPAGEISLVLARGDGTCRIREANVLWITEEGWGRLVLYFYRTQDEARQTASSWSVARILLDFSGYMLRKKPLLELQAEGPAWPRSTLRKAVQELNHFWDPNSLNKFLFGGGQ